MAGWADAIDLQPTDLVRSIEMYVGRVEPQDWYTVDVEIPADTPEEKIEEVATAELLKIVGKGDVYPAFNGVYHVPSADERDDADIAEDEPENENADELD